MSHIASYSTRIRLPVNPGEDLKASPAWEVLTGALEVTAREHNGAVTDFISDYYGRRWPCTLALVVPEFPLGIGLEVDTRTGEIRFVYDHYGHESTVGRICDAINQNYTAVAVTRALRSLHYQVDLEEFPAGNGGAKRVLIKGEL